MLMSYRCKSSQKSTGGKPRVKDQLGTAQNGTSALKKSLKVSSPLALSKLKTLVYIGFPFVLEK